MAAVTEIRVTAPLALADDITALFYEAEWPFQEADQGTLDPPPAGQIRYHLFIDPAERDEVLGTLRESLDLPAGAVAVLERDDAEWRDAWKRAFHTRRIGRFAIVPSWESAAHQEAPGEVTLHLDPGRAFGTGGHASTRLCLAYLDRLLSPSSSPSPAGLQVLDVGCGCGVLAIAALRSGAERAIAIDIDPEAIEVTQENAVRNGVDSRLVCETTPLGLVPGTFGLILANVTGPTLNNLAEALVKHLGPGGSLVLAGLLASEAPGLMARFTALGLLPGDPPQLGDDEDREWLALLLRRPA